MIGQTAPTDPQGAFTNVIADLQSRLRDVERGRNASAGVPQNYIINGDFRVHQRGSASVNTHAAWVVDRWWMVLFNGAMTCSQQAFGAGTQPSTAPVYEPRNYLRCVVSGYPTATNDAAVLRQNIEDLSLFTGKQVTVSFWARAASGTPRVAVELTSQFGTGGSANVNTYAATVTLSTTWTRYQVTTVVPSSAGKTIGPANSTSLRLSFWLSAGSTFDALTGSLGTQNGTFEFWGVQVEHGARASTFTPRLYADELALCQRYFQRITGAAVGGPLNYIAWLGTSYSQKIPFVVTPRTTPNATWGHNVAGDGLALPYVAGGAIAPVAAALPVWDSSWRAQIAGNFVYFDMAQGVTFDAEMQ